MKGIIALLIMCLLLTGCAARERTVYTGGVLDITSSGAQIRVISHDDGREYTYTLRRVRRAKNAAVSEKTILETDTFTIISAGNMWMVVTPETKIYVRW